MRHILNPMHVECRMVGLGMGRGLSRKISGIYQKIYTKIL